MSNIQERITRQEIADYKREILETTVLVRLEEAATMLAVSTSTILRRVDDGKLTPYSGSRNKKHYRFLASELQQYVRDMRVKMKE